jgi:hypothetical protein
MMKRSDFISVSFAHIVAVKNILQGGSCRDTMCNMCPFNLTNSPKKIPCVKAGFKEGGSLLFGGPVLKKSCEDFLAMVADQEKEKKESEKRNMTIFELCEMEVRNIFSGRVDIPEHVKTELVKAALVGVCVALKCTSTHLANQALQGLTMANFQDSEPN